MLNKSAYLIIYLAKEPSEPKISKLLEGLESISNDFKERNCIKKVNKKLN